MAGWSEGPLGLRPIDASGDLPTGREFDLRTGIQAKADAAWYEIRPLLRGRAVERAGTGSTVVAKPERGVTRAMENGDALARGMAGFVSLAFRSSSLSHHPFFQGQHHATPRRRPDSP